LEPGDVSEEEGEAFPDFPFPDYPLPDAQPVETVTVFMVRTLPSINAAGVLKAIQHMRVALASNGCIVIRIHSDRGTEFVSKPLTTWCLAEAIRQTSTTGNDPRSNGRAERGVGMAKQGARRNLVSSGLPVERWPWACSTGALVNGPSLLTCLHSCRSVGLSWSEKWTGNYSTRFTLA
jgi:hypothetical protein